MALIDRKLTELKLSRELVDVYRDRITDESLTGVVVDFNYEFLYMSLLTDDGEDNGISVFYRRDISRIRTGGNVRSSVGELGQFRATELKLPSIDISSIDTIVSSVQSQYGYVNLHTEEMNDEVCFIGEIIERDEKWLSLLGYGTMIARDKNTLLLQKDDISRVDAGAKYEESIKYLADKS